MGLFVWMFYTVLITIINYHLAIRRGHGRGATIVLSILFGVFTTGLLLAMVPPHWRRCPYCQSWIADQARRCPHCQVDAPFGAPPALP